MISRQLTAEERVALLARMKEDERQQLEAWGTNWEKIRNDCELEMSQARADSETPKLVNSILTTENGK